MSGSVVVLSRYDFGTAESAAASKLIELGIREDLADAGDVTSQALIPSGQQGTVAIVARQNGIVCGLPIARLILQNRNSAVQLQAAVSDGDVLLPGQMAAVLSGPIRDLLTYERTILNFLTHLSGIATLTSRFVAAVLGKCQVLDTRKTHPGYRLLEKYAVRCGGGSNHRLGLFDGIMLKDNHIAARRVRYPQESRLEMIRQARASAPGLPLTVEVDSLEQLRELLPGQPDIFLLDNMDLPTLKQAVEMRDLSSKKTLLEASGGVTLETAAEIASTGVDRISVGALTHSAPAFDLAFDWQTTLPDLA